MPFEFRRCSEDGRAGRTQIRAQDNHTGRGPGGVSNQIADDARHCIASNKRSIRCVGNLVIVDTKELSLRREASTYTQRSSRRILPKSRSLEATLHRSPSELMQSAGGVSDVNGNAEPPASIDNCPGKFDLREVLSVAKYISEISGNWQQGVDAFMNIARLCAEANGADDCAKIGAHVLPAFRRGDVQQVRPNRNRHSPESARGSTAAAAALHVDIRLFRKHREAMPNETEKGPLSNLRVLDLSRILAGPTCTQLLGDLGADIIKVEKPPHGDDTRSWGPPFVINRAGEATTESAYYLCTNRNKRSIVADLATKAGASIIRRLVKTCDVMSISLAASQALIYKAAKNAGSGFPDMREAAQAKILASDSAIKVTNDALQLHGAAGYSRDLPLERMVRDARMFAIGGGTAQMLRNQVAGSILGMKLPQTRDGYIKLETKRAYVA